MDKYAVIVAGGNGTRMNSSLPKQFLELKGKPLLWHTLNVFRRTFPDIKIILVVPSGHFSIAEKLVAIEFPEADIKLITGGETRFHSVKNGLNQVGKDSIVFIHDAVRCLVSSSLLQRCYETALKDGSAVPATKPKDSIRKITSTGSEVADREMIRQIQTPQVFKSSVILKAFETAYKPSFTDEATVAEDAGFTVTLVEGEERNIKITTPIDLIIAEAVMNS